MCRRFSWLAVIALVIVLTACVGPVPKIDATSAALAPIKTITIIRPPEPRTYTVLNLGHPGMAFGLIGAIIATADRNAKQEKLTKVFRQQGVGVSAELAWRISASLTQIGYQCKIEDGPWQEVDDKYDLLFEKIKSDGDAVLVIAPTTIGFFTSGIGGGQYNDYLPTITSTITLLGKDRTQQIYRGYHAYGWNPGAEGWRHTATKKTFSNFNALMSNPKLTAQSLTVAAIGIASTVARDLPRAPSSEKISTPDIPQATGELLPAQKLEVHSSITPPTSSIPAPSIASRNAPVPFLAERGQEQFRDFLKKPFPRAFAISDTGHYWRVWGHRGQEITAPPDVKDQALQGCREAAGKECVLYMVDNLIVYQR